MAKYIVGRAKALLKPHEPGPPVFDIPDNALVDHIEIVGGIFFATWFAPVPTKGV